jgi:hypothetical protein
MHSAQTPTGFKKAPRATTNGVHHRANVQPLRGWCGGFALGPGVRCATPGSVVGLLRSQFIQHPGTERHTPRPNPEGVQHHSPGSRSAPRERTPSSAPEPQRGSTSQPRVAQRTLGKNDIHCAQTPTGFNTALRATPNGIQHRAMYNPFGVGVVISRVVPGCAARPRALLCDRVAVGRLTTSVWTAEAFILLHALAR